MRRASVGRALRTDVTVCASLLLLAATLAERPEPAHVLRTLTSNMHPGRLRPRLFNQRRFHSQGFRSAMRAAGLIPSKPTAADSTSHGMYPSSCRTPGWPAWAVSRASHHSSSAVTPRSA
ncbi:hypothetical protein ACWGDS_43480 [Streptomyces sp. NPDC055059]